MSFALHVMCPACGNPVPLPGPNHWITLDKPYCSTDCANQHALSDGNTTGGAMSEGKHHEVDLTDGIDIQDDTDTEVAADGSADLTGDGQLNAGEPLDVALNSDEGVSDEMTVNDALERDLKRGGPPPWSR